MVRQYDDRVISGDAVSVLKDLALCLSVIASLEDPVRRHCGSCASSSASMMEQAWEGFPDIPSIASAPSKMRRGCANCLEKTQNALDRSIMIHKAGVQRASYLAFSRTR